jgi:hypothetical protein
MFFCQIDMIIDGKKLCSGIQEETQALLYNSCEYLVTASLRTIKKHKILPEKFEVTFFEGEK